MNVAAQHKIVACLQLEKAEFDESYNRTTKTEHAKFWSPDLTDAKHFPLSAAANSFASHPRPAEIIPGVTKLSDLVFSKGNFQLRYYQPGDVDRQVPHDQEELYVVVAGEAILDCEGKRKRMSSGDAAYVPKMADHRFVEATGDFAVWVIYFDA